MSKRFTVRGKLGSVQSPVTPGVTGERRQVHRELQADQSEAMKSSVRVRKSKSESESDL